MKIFLTFFLLSIEVFAQNFLDTSTVTFLSKNVKISGEVGAYGELSSIKGRPERRPPSAYRIYARPTLSLFDLIHIPLDFFISSEGNKTKQTINYFGIAPSWEWGKFYAGDFSEELSELTLSNINIRGSGLVLYPDFLNFALLSGFTSQAVEGGAANGSYNRFLLAGKIGYGKKDESHLNLIVLKAKDKVSSLDQNKKSINIIFPNGDDKLPVGSIQTIIWNSYNSQGNVNIEISRDGGNSFSLIASDQPNTGFYDWVVSGNDSYNSILRISSVEDSTLKDISDYPFIIAFGIPAERGNLIPITENYNAVTPQENLIIAFDGGLNLFEEKVKFSTELSGSAFTKDLRSSAISLDSINMPGFVKGIYKPTISSNADYALNSKLELNFQPVNLSFGFKRIGAGYNSLGLSYLLNDQQEFNTNIMVNLFPYYFSVSYGRVNDNLIDQKLFTTLRNNFGFMAGVNLTSNWNAGIFTNILGMNNNSNNDSSKINFSNFVIGLNNNFQIANLGYFKGISFSYTYQGSENNSIFIKDGRTKANSGTLGLSFVFDEEFNASTNFSIVDAKVSETIKNTITTYSINAMHTFLQNKINASLTIGYSNSPEIMNYSTSLNTGYRITNSDNLSLAINYTNYNAKENFNEIRSSLNISHRF